MGQFISPILNGVDESIHPRFLSYRWLHAICCLLLFNWEQIEKDFGKGSIMKLGAASAKMNIETIPTGALSLDIALGVGGIPRGRIIEIYGPESSGKTTVALHMIAEAQKRGGYAAFIDAEHALDPEYARHLGVDIDNLLISQPDTGELALEICDALVRSGAIDIIVIDSVAALVPKQAWKTRSQVGYL